MDKRKIDKFKQDHKVHEGILSESQKAQLILNSSKVNEALLHHAE